MRMIIANNVPRWLFVAVSSGFFILTGSLFAVEPDPITLPAQPGVPAPDQDDATLRGVAIVGQNCWVVGDRGTVWKSNN
ncbi:MAG TPA: hypothetical protein VNQ76_18395, partial [Planctomicrobium sp.]|nr:hypothetical protein [Planctomicrobium sp.]